MTTDMPAENRTPEPPPTLPDMPPTGHVGRSFEDLTLAEALGHLLLSPRRTWRGLRQTLFGLPQDRFSAPVLDEPMYSAPAAPATTAEATADTTQITAIARAALDWRALTPALALSGVFLLALGASVLLFTPGSRTTPTLPPGGVLMIGAAALMAVFAVINLAFPRLPALEPPAKGKPIRDAEELFRRYWLRIALAGAAIMLSLLAWLFDGNNSFTAPGVFCWIMSVVAWYGVLYDRRADLSGQLERQIRRGIDLFRRPATLRWSWTLAALIAILIVGAWFRFNNLSAYPPDMTSDHVEKALDTNRVLNGARTVFFPNNGGRESFQMYYLAVLKNITGLPITFDLLKIGSGLEGMLMILLAWWMGRAVIGEEDRHLGNLTGLIMAALVATSYWHTMLSRLGLRIVTTTLITTIVFIFLARGLRHNRRSDFLIAGLALGAGMYFYQAVRMLPVVVIVGLVLAIVIRARNWRTARSYLINGAALVIISLAVFVPLARYWQQYPSIFWERAGGRLLGEDTIEIKSAQGSVIGRRSATFEDRLAAFRENLPKLIDNLWRSAWMFNWRGDAAWVTGEPGGLPELDPVTGTLYMLGLGLIAARIVRRRDPVDWLLPISILIMLLPTALSIAYVIEVPSATRASGAFPMVYLVAALALAVIVRFVARQFSGRRLRVALYAVLVGLLIVGALTNANSYFVEAMKDYRASTFPYGQVGRFLKGFAESTGAFGNAFMIAYDYWWDHRAIAIEAGDPDWPNGIFHDSAIERVKVAIRSNMGGKYELNPDRQMMFFVYQTFRQGKQNVDQETLDALQAWLPGGETLTIQSFSREKDWIVYVLPPPGCDWIAKEIGFINLSTYCRNPRQESAPGSR